ncbi:MAG: type II toxin-antitoxin system HicA family toxin [Ignavibacterium sp.]
MPKLTKLTGKQLIRVLKKFGFEIIRIKGSHTILKHSDRRMTVVSCSFK